MIQYSGKEEKVSERLDFVKSRNGRALCGLLPLLLIHGVECSSKQAIQECTY